MRVLQLGPFPPPWGGVQANLVAIRDYLREQGIPCAVVNITRHRKQDADGVYYPLSAGHLVRLLLRLPYDVLHLHIGGDLTFRLLALSAVCCSVPGKKTVLTFHSGGYPSSPAGRTARPATLRGFVLRQFDAVIGVNAELTKLLQKFGVPAERVHLIQPHAVAMPRTPAYPEPLRSFMRGHSPVLITVGLLEPEYDLPLQVEAIGQLRERFPGAGLVIAGSGSLEADLRKRIAAAPWSDHVLLYGDMPHEITMQAISDSDAMWRTTLYDGDSVSVREALHLGTPVIASDNSMRPAGVRLVPAQDAAGLVTATAETLERGEKVRFEQSGRGNLEAVLNLYRTLTKDR